MGAADVARLLYRAWVAVGMYRQGFDLQLTQYDDRGWRATFYTTGMEHSPTSATGTAWERTPWRATQRAASETLKKPRSVRPAPPDISCPGNASQGPEVARRMVSRSAAIAASPHASGRLLDPLPA
jgi:hypothetical protein